MDPTPTHSSAKDPSNPATPEASKVIFVRNVPNDCSEVELAAAFQHYGPIDKVMTMNEKSHAFVQFLNLIEAQTCLQQVSSGKAKVMLEDRELLISQSNHPEITNRSKGRVQTASPVLLVTITKLKYPVNVDVLFAVFNKYGEVLRIIIFDKDKSQQALVEMGDAAQATKAKDSVNGQHIYSASNMMTVQYSTRNKLSVTGQSSKARDFTRLDEKVEDEAPMKRPRIDLSGGVMPDANGQKMALDKEAAGLLGRQEFAELFMRSFEQTGAAEQFDRGAIESQLQSWQQSNQLGGGESSIFSSKHMVDEQSPLNRKTMPNYQAADPQSKHGPKALTRTILVYGLPETDDYATLLKHMFKLFCTMGNVKRIKILYKKRTSAFVQYEDAEYARVAKNELHNVPFFGARLQMSFSKHDQITRFSEDMLDEVQKNLCHDFSTDGSYKEYRFKGVTAKAFQYVAPAAILHFAGVPEDMTVEVLQAKMDTIPDLADCKVVGQKVFSVPSRVDQSKRVMMLVEFADRAMAVKVLCHLHYTEIGGRRAFISFGKSSLSKA